jgi:hypothetical protein
LFVAQPHEGIALHTFKTTKPCPEPLPPPGAAHSPSLHSFILMATYKLSKPELAEQLAYTFMLKGYELCRSTLGMGFLQAVESMDISSVAKHCVTQQDYANAGFTRISADYLAGRMMKTGISYSSDGRVIIDDRTPTPDYQGWASGSPVDPGIARNYSPEGKLPSYLALLELACQNCGVELTPA